MCIFGYTNLVKNQDKVVIGSDMHDKIYQKLHIVSLKLIKKIKTNEAII